MVKLQAIIYKLRLCGLVNVFYFTFFVTLLINQLYGKDISHENLILRDKRFGVWKRPRIT